VSLGAVTSTGATAAKLQGYDVTVTQRQTGGGRRFKNSSDRASHFHVALPRPSISSV